MGRLNNRPQMTLAQARDIWEADKGDYEKARQYGFCILSAHHLAQLTTADAEAMLNSTADAAMKAMTPEEQAALSQRVEVGELASAIAAAIGHAFGDEPSDGIGRPQGNA